jgi:DNA mismatch repair protein MutL
MNTIKRLSNHVVNQIAAGEVIDRPVSVIKELVENSIDAKAKNITIEMENGGKNLIAVHDDGLGMSAADLELAIERHATSKLDESDISKICHFGFRGEALPSIGSVSKLKIISKTAACPTAHAIIVSGGDKSAITPHAGEMGTTIEVRDLFCFTPARLKFLKSEASEKMQAIDLVNRFALAHPNVAFKFIYNGKVMLNYKESPERIYQILGEDFKENSIYFEEAHGDLKISCYASLPTFHTANSLSEYIFVNGRTIKDKLLQVAIRSSYRGLITDGRYAVIALFLQVDTYDVDVNVHPAKAEVRFKEADRVRDQIIHAIRKNLRNAAFQQAAPAPQAAELARVEPSRVMAFQPHYQARPAYNPQPIAEPIAANFATYSMPKAATAINENKQSYVIPSFEEPPLGYAKFQVGNNYIIAHNKEGLIIVDQHAAHERIVLEQFKEETKDGKVKNQLLLSPHIERLGEGQASLLLQFKPALQKYGFIIEPMGTDTIMVQAIPDLLTGVNITDLLAELLGHLAESESADIIAHKLEEVLGNFACHHSIRSGRTLNIEEMNHLLRQIEKTDFSSQCNHGRPTFHKLTVKELAKIDHEKHYRTSS